MIQGSSLRLLKDGELCIVIIGNEIRECEWSVEHRCWFFPDGDGPRSANPAEVDEWLPASALLRD